MRKKTQGEKEVPAAHAVVDWAKDHVFLDKELRKVARDAALGRRLVDKLARVHTLEGAEAWGWCTSRCGERSRPR